MDLAALLLTTNRMPIRDAAIAFARAGVPVFPCAREGKRPLTSTGFHDASCDVDQVETWWARWPEANLGMPTGSASGIDVVDVDAKGVAGSGFPAFERAATAGLVDGELARVRTPSGGLHVYYPAMRSRPQRCWQVAHARIDFRGTGGYVIAPPSSLATDRGRVAYRLFSVSTAHSKPVDSVALREFIDPRQARLSTRSAGPAAAGTLDPSRLAGWVGRLQEGERNAGLFWAACRLAEAGLPPDAVVSALAAAAARAGLADAEIATTIRSASRQASARPARMPGPMQTPPIPWSAPPSPPRRAGDSRCLP
ncbi:bifunctional DNA primase/polymerase [Agromyces laixinhei]|uniref:bifunctional DNA primase/polymerase n=1 Tax=Agromyces laixinhei TaxID=2585717 RepID=UPI0012ED9805|nr:bifunctional DNA primase/polymerase [Agromyces laixinhei]